MFKVEIKKKQEGIFTVFLEGSLDSDTYEQLEKQVAPLLNEKTKALIFDFKNLSYISSMGLNTVFKIKGQLEEIGGKIVIVNIQPPVKKVFDVVKILPENIFKDISEIDVYLAKIQRKAEGEDYYSL